MINSDFQNEKFALNVSQAAMCLRNNEFENAYIMIVEAMSIDPDAPHPHNLLGVFYELKGDGNRARKHYRAAYSLDPTYRPACWNLEQICTVLDVNLRTYDLGDKADESRKVFSAAEKI